MKDIETLRLRAQNLGVFLPLLPDTDPLTIPEKLHGRELPGRAVLVMQPGNDATENGAPTEDTVSRYVKAVQQRQYSIIYTEPAAVSVDGRDSENALALTEENESAFAALVSAVREAAEKAFGTAPMFFALLHHAGQNALKAGAVQESESLPEDMHLFTDEELSAVIVQSGTAAQVAEKAGFTGAALNAADRSLYGESLAAFHRSGKFGGDFDDRSRFVRDCYTAMKMMTEKLLFSVRLSLSDGIPQPDGWGMAFEDEAAPDLYEPALLLKILQALYDVKLVLCTVGIPGINWMNAEEPEGELITISRLCTCIAMLDSDMQQNIYLIVPEQKSEMIPFENLAAGMIIGEFASFAGYAG